MNRILSTRTISKVLRASLSLRLIVFCLTVLLVASGAAHAQLAGKGAITGTVFDASGAAIPDATVVMTNGATGISTTTTSTSAGDFSVSTLDPGVYTVTVTAKGFEKLRQEDVHVNALETVSLNPKLTVGASDQSVTITAAPPQLETTNATLGATMEQDMYAALPIEMGAYGQPDQRRATDFAFLMPGVQGNNTTGNPTTNTGIVNGSGSRGGVTAVYIDGLPFVRAGGNGDPRYIWTAISVDAVNQFQVQTNGYSAIYEGQGIQNYTIKQGANKWHGAVYEFFRNTALDTWGFYRANNPLTGLPAKPIEHQNEYGINFGGPLVPFGTWKDKLFFFGNYNGYRYSSTTPTPVTFPTFAQQNGNFTGVIPGGVWDPNSQAACTANSTNGPCRYRYGYSYAGTPGPGGNPILTGTPDVIPASQFSQAALALQQFIPQLTNQNLQNNYYAPNATALNNWSTTERIDYTTQKDQLTLMAAIGRQASSFPVGQAQGSGRNVAGVPYNYGQAYAPKTAVGIIEETHTFTPHLVNQFKYGYARYNGPTFDADQLPQYSASALGFTGLPSGPAQTAFPFVTFSGTNAPTGWSGSTPNGTIAQNYTLVDNIQWVAGKHTVTFGGQIAWLLYNVTPATGGSTPLTLAASVTETAQITASSNTSPKYAAAANTGAAYASFLVGQIDKGSLTQYLDQSYGSRFRAYSPYVQDNWKVTDKLTLDLGLRWDIFPSVRENHGFMSFFNPNLPNPVTGINGALQYAGDGANTCNCQTPVNTYFKNIGPRIGLAYQVDPKTVVRASYGVMYTHGNGVGGGTASQTGMASNALGFSAAPSFSANGQLLSTFPLMGSNMAVPAGMSTPAAGRASGPAYGTGYTTVAGYTGTPSSSQGYADPYLGGRAPQYINWSFGFQHQWTDAFTSTITYVGSQGHFLQADGSNARGFWADQLDPKYLALGSSLNLTGAAETTFCATSGDCPSYYTKFNTSQSVATLLHPFPFQNVSDPYGNVANSNYHSLQMSFNMRPTHGITFMANYTWSRSIDDAGTFRSGYAIPAFASGNGKAYAIGRMDRSVSTSSQPQHVVITGVWDLPIGRQILANQAWERAVLGGLKFSTIFQAYSGSPLAITSSVCATNPAQSSFSSPAGACMPNLNPAFIGRARINGKWGQGATSSVSKSYIDSTAFTGNNAYQFGNAPRTAPYDIYGPGNNNLDISLRRSFNLHILNSSRFNIQADLYNVTNHTQFSVASAVYGNASFGQVNAQANKSRSAQLSGRIEF
ncbi:TonB-dependent receptor [Granulicella mallensis]|nr:TonB-dependent receptor [Granulicella mallensis]